MENFNYAHTPGPSSWRSQLSKTGMGSKNSPLDLVYVSLVLLSFLLTLYLKTLKEASYKAGKERFHWADSEPA
jgi:hypothetical protein